MLYSSSTLKTPILFHGKRPQDGSILVGCLWAYPKKKRELKRCACRPIENPMKVLSQKQRSYEDFAPTSKKYVKVGLLQHDD